MTDLKAVVVGAGPAGATHVAGWKAQPRCEVIAICDLDPGRAQEVAREWDVPHQYASLEEALADQKVDVVSVCTPPSTHFDVCMEALQAGCHVLVEKPIFQSMEEAERIREVSTAVGRKVSAVHNYKYQPGFQAAIHLERKGLIGDVTGLHIRYMINGDQNRMTHDPNFWGHKLPGGRWEEMIPHPIYKAYHFAGPLSLLHLGMKTVHNRWPWLPADEVEIVLEGKHTFVTIQLSADTHPKYNYMLVYGSKKAVYIDHSQVVDLMTLKPIRSIRDLGSGRDFGKRVRHDSRRLLTKVLRRSKFPLADRLARITRPASRGPHAQLIAAFAAHVRGELVEPPVDWDEALNTLDLTLQVGRAIQSRRAENAP